MLDTKRNTDTNQAMEVSVLPKAAFLFALGVLAALLLYLWGSDNLSVHSSRGTDGYYTVENVSCRELERADAPIGIARECVFTLMELERDTYLAFYTVHQNVEVFIDNQLVYSAKPRTDSMVKTIGSNWFMVPLCREDEGKEIRVNILPVYEDVRNREVVFLVGSQLSICVDRLKQDLPQLVLSLFAIFIGIVFLCSCVYKRVNRRDTDGLDGLGLFALILGLWRLSDTRFTPFLAPNKPVFLYYLSLAMLMIGIVPLLQSLQTHFNRRIRRVMNVFCVVASAICIILVLCQVVGSIDLRESLVIIHLMIGLGALILAGSAVCEWLKGQKNQTRVITPKASLILIAGVLADFIDYYIRRTSSGLIVSLVAMLIYISILGVNMMLLYVEKEKKIAEIDRHLAEQERQLTESRISSMMSQIKPHFIYNTLGSIEQLCRVQPETAADLVHNFAKYLRGNVGKLGSSAPIRLSQEIEHVRCYLYIEKTRFPDITVGFDLQSEDFLLPALTVQPLVENAIKHGLMKLPQGGSVHIMTYETEDAYCVQVRDTVAGFDIDKLWEDQTHVGLRNIRGRLEAMCGGTLTVESTPGVGTTATIRIPREDKP